MSNETMRAKDQADEARVAHTLRRARTAAGLSLRELAHRAGTSHTTLLAYEQGKKTPTVATFTRILDAAGFAVDFVLSRHVRSQDGIGRGDELAQVLERAGEFPARHRPRTALPPFAKA
jgi:transcriptional regulator with XRE-family HTH domain